MGREEEANRQARQAELERALGPIRAFESVAECQKCALPTDHPNFSRRWCMGQSLLAPSREGCQQVGEHLHVICPRCHYGWLEHCKDHVDEDAPINFSAAMDAAVGTTVTPRIITE